MGVAVQGPLGLPPSLHPHCFPLQPSSPHPPLLSLPHPPLGLPPPLCPLQCWQGWFLRVQGGVAPRSPPSPRILLVVVEVVVVVVV